MDNETRELTRQASNEALVSLVLPMVHEAINIAAQCVANDCEISQNEAKQALIRQWIKYISKHPQHALNMDILSVWTGYHPAMDYEAPFTPNNDTDDSDDISPYGNVA